MRKHARTGLTPFALPAIAAAVQATPDHGWYFTDRVATLTGIRNGSALRNCRLFRN